VKTQSALAPRFISSLRIRQNLIRFRDVSVALAGILLFAAFIHRTGPLRYLAMGGLSGTALIIGYSIRHISFLPAFGISKPGRKTFFYTLPAVITGLCLGMLTRNKFGLSLLPSTLGILALISPIIGALEELVFRGYMQGHLFPLGRIFPLIFAATAHTGYKSLVIFTQSSPLQFDLTFLIMWTFFGGIAFGILRESSGSVIPPAIAHVVFDIVLYGGLSVAPVWVWS
jgi:membrane protease YdiL (CAAX protease family)